MIIHYPLLPARPHDSQQICWLALIEGVMLAGKGFINAWRQAELARKQALESITPSRKNMQVNHRFKSRASISADAKKLNRQVASDGAVPDC